MAAPATRKRIKRAKPASEPGVHERERMRRLIDAMDESGEDQKRAKQVYDEVRGEVLEALEDVWSDHFEEIHDGIRRKADVVRSTSQVVQDSILEDLRPEVVGRVTKLDVIEEALMSAILSGEIDQALVNRITRRVVDPVRLNAAIERNEIPLAVVEKHTVTSTKKPFPRITRKETTS